MRAPRVGERPKTHVIARKWGSTLALLLLAVIVVSLYDRPHFIWSEPGLWVVGGALTVAVLRLAQIPVLGSLFYLAGAASLLWTLTPANTLINGLWELVYLAAMAVGHSVIGFGLINVVLVVKGLERTLLLDFFNLTQYFSGSAHYIAGAQALLFLPLAISASVKGSSRLIRSSAFILSIAGFLLVLNSGSRAVYLPAVFLLPLVIARLAYPRGLRRRALSVPLASLAMVLVLGAVLPGPTIWTPLGVKVSQTGGELSDAAESESETPAAEARPVTVEGGIGSRLKMWDQTMRIGLEHPLGTGAGSFRNTIHAFQRYPLIGFSSPHNVFLETFSTGGWLRLLLLLGLVGGSIWSGWRSDRWPIAVGAAGIWATMSFDITGQMPAVMALGFLSLASSSSMKRADGVGKARLRIGLGVVCLTLVAAAAAWWYWPCDSVGRCAVERHMGYRAEILAAVNELDSDQELAERAVELNPASYWAWQLRAMQAETTSSQLETKRDLATRFPLSSPRLYLDWAESALVASRPEEARRALTTGLEAFPANLDPAGVPFGGRAGSYSDWLIQAKSMLDSLDEPID